MQTLEIQVPDELAQRLETLVAEQGTDYESLNSDLKGRDALLGDLLLLGLDELIAGEDEFPDDE
ncbi:hypothetical protein [Candidatus Venteria ishoeyi]|uniref:Uncharacterized protein n=1 Tax=Candidatus Venteria ishoeyi TaxID=1899563 RepID=A0A1H6FCN1_9GAMM|nr:hypothetical protein [Candidatus Venteria ishoeyi]MDM8545259.1 hypothetical protein [Candidatus Venteria ishoeyi]SEH07079.1 Uncharacterised protein [Candidatus Venteria ishoeyi]